MRVIRLYDQSQCGADNPFFVTRVVVPNRRFFEFLERLELAENVPFPYSTRTWSVNGLDPVALQEVFNIVGLQDRLNLYFGDNVSVFELFTTDKVNTSQVRLDDVVFISESFQVSRASGYNLPLFGEVVNLAEAFTYAFSQTKDQNLFDQLSITEQFAIQRGTFKSLFFLDSLGVSDDLSVTGSANVSNGFSESLSLGELWEFFRFRISSLCTNYQRDLEAIGGEVYNLSKLCQNLNALNPNVRPPQESFNAFQDFLSLVEIFSYERSRSFGNEIESMVSVAELFAFRAATIRLVGDLVDQMAVNEDFSYNAGASYSQALSDITNIAEEFAFSKGVRVLYGFEDATSVSEFFVTDTATQTNQLLSDGVALAEMFSFGQLSTYVKLLEDNVAVNDTLQVLGSRNINNGFTESLSLGEQWDLYTFGESALCANYVRALEEIGGEVYNYSALCQNLNALNINVRPPQIRSQSYQEALEVDQEFDVRRTTSFTQALVDQLALQDAFDVVRTRNVTNNALDHLTLSEFFTILGQTDKVYNLFFDDAVSILENRDVRDRTFQIGNDFVENVNAGELFAFSKTTKYTLAFVEDLRIDATSFTRVNQEFSIYFEERVDLVGVDDFIDVRKPSARLLTFVDGVNLIEGNN